MSRQTVHDISAPTEHGWWASRAALAVVLPVVLFLVLRPERYGLKPNPLDPVFYTGYAINFDDMIREVGDSHYFVSRWSAYLPNTVGSVVFGPYWGRLVVRWLAASTILLSLFHLGRSKWKPNTEIAVGVVALTTPMFVRSFMTDYVEWFFVASGIVLYCQCLEPKVRWARSILIGVLAALILVANPPAVLITMLPGVAWLVGLWRSDDRVLPHMTAAGGAAIITVLAGHVWFRVVYGLDVYRPTIDFIRSPAAAISDPLKSPQLDWMGAYVWIYVPLILFLGVLTIPSIRRSIRIQQLPLFALAAVVIQWAIQVIDQFGRDGIGLEISYYWSFIVPSLTLALASLLGLVDWTRRWLVVFVAAWLVVLVHPAVIDTALPGGWWFAFLVAAFLIGVGSFRSLPAGGAVGALVLFTLLAQVAAPSYDPSAYHSINTNPDYDRLFLGTADSDAELNAAIWLADQLDSLESDADLEFAAGGFGSLVVGIYGPHVTGNLLSTREFEFVDGADGGLNDVTEFRARLGTIGKLAVYGPPDYVENVRSELLGWNSGIETLLDVVDGADTHYRLLVLDTSHADSQGAVLTGADLFSHTGLIAGSSRHAAAGVHPPGFLTFGPYIHFDSGTYIAKFSYRSDAPSSTEDGFFDVAIGTETVSTTPLVGTDGEGGEVTIHFEVPIGGRAEFRALWNGGHDLTLDTVSVSKE